MYVRPWTMFIWKWASLRMLFVWVMRTHAWQNWLKHSGDWLRWCLQFNERSHMLVWATWASFTAWPEPGVETGSQASESICTRSLLAFIMPHYYLHSPLIIHTDMICSWTVGECQCVQGLYLRVTVCRSVFWTKRVFVRVKSLDLHYLDYIAFQW